MDRTKVPALTRRATGTGSRNRRGRRRSGEILAHWRRHFAPITAGLLFLASSILVRAEVKVGDPFPALAPAGVVALGDGPLPETAGKVVLVDFWASWCAPCKASFPALARLHADYAARGLVLAAVSVDEKPAAAVAFVKKQTPPFAPLHDREQKLVRLVEVPAMPTTYLIGRDGRVRSVHQGYHGEATDRELRKQIEALLAEKN